MIAAHMAGIKVFVTGGIGGVHRGAETSKYCDNFIKAVLMMMVMIMTTTIMMMPMRVQMTVTVAMRMHYTLAS